MTPRATPFKDIVAAVQSVVGDAARPVALHEPLFSGNEKKYVMAAIDDGWVSSAGAYVERFERDLAVACGAKHAVAMVNGTCALHAALSVMGVKPGDEVLVPSLTFVATANAVMHAGATPHFVEVEDTSLGIDPEKLAAYLAEIATMKNGETVHKKTGRVIRAIVPVDVFGHPCERLALKAVADHYNLAMIEDATEALGSLRQGKPVGGEGVAVLSFNGNKIITTGGGGAVLTDDAALARTLKHISSTAKTPHAWAFNHDAVAWNYRLPGINAALGCAQLEQLEKFVTAKRALAARYIKTFSGMRGVNVLKEPAGTRSNYWLVALLLDAPEQLEETLSALHAAKLLCRPVWTPLHQLPMYRDAPRADLRLTETLAGRIVNLPSSAKLGLDYV